MVTSGAALNGGPWGVHSPGQPGLGQPAEKASNIRLRTGCPARGGERIAGVGRRCMGRGAGPGNAGRNPSRCRADGISPASNFTTSTQHQV